MPERTQKGGGYGMSPDQERAPSIEQQIAELKAAGWVMIRQCLWKAPDGTYFFGPQGAWKAMKRRAELEQSA